MRSARLGRSGLKVSEISLGAFEWGRRVDAQTAQELLDLYASAGGDVLEIPSFSSPALPLLGELRLPRAVRLVARVGAAVEHGRPVTRLGRIDLLRDVRLVIAESRADALDVLVLDTFDPQTPLEETASALSTLLERGDVGAVMVSHHSAWQVAVVAAAVPLVGAIDEYSLLDRGPEADLIPALRHLGLGLIAGAGLGRGVLTGQYLRGTPRGSRAGGDYGDYIGELLDEHSTSVVQGVVRAATGLGVEPIDIALAWARESGAASTLVAPRTREQLEQILASDLTLQTEIRDVLDQISDPYA